jgi:hypothetical protein
MSDSLEDRIRAHYDVMGRQPMPAALEDRLLERRRRQAATPRWVGVVVGMATAALVFAAIAVPLLVRTNGGPSPGPGGASLGAIRADFVVLVNTDATNLGTNLNIAQSVCAGAATLAQQTSSCTTTINGLTSELLEINTAFNAATVPGGVAAQMAQLVQALGAFASAYSNGSTQTASVVVTDATTVESDLRILQQALATS